MKKPALRLLIAALAVLAIVAFVVVNRTSLPLSATSASAHPPHPATASVTAPSERAAPPGFGHDGGMTTAPARAADALTDVPSSRPALAPGTTSRAWVQAGEKTTEVLRPNQSGEFPRVYISAGQEVGVRLGFPEKEPGTHLTAAVEDGGKLADGKHALALTLDDRRETVFRFTADTAPGQYRITVRLGPDIKVVTLWVTAEPRVAAGRQNLSTQQ